MGGSDATSDALAEMQPDQPWTASQEDLTSAGLYSPKELQEWRSKILFPSYKEATLRAVAYGSCLADGECQAEASIPLYNLEKLAPGIPDRIRACSKFKERLREWGDLLAFCCILIILCRIAADFCTEVTAAIR